METQAPSRKARPASIRIHTMLGRVKIYEATNWWTSKGCLWIIGTNIDSNHTGRFSFPMVNMEHFNIDEHE